MIRAMAGVRVQKFGGAALADGAGVLRSAQLALREAGPRAVLVVSAHAGVTDLLESTARRSAGARPDEIPRLIEPLRIRHRSLLRELGLVGELCDHLLGELGTLLTAVAESGDLTPAQLDFAMSFGERLSARIVAATLRSQGADAVPVDAWDLGLRTDSNHGRARPLPGVREALGNGLGSLGGLPVITGFLAADPGGNLTTLGRNGTDLTAALVAEALEARELVLWKAMPGVLRGDPKFWVGTSVLPTMTWDEASELARAGATVLHPGTVEPLLRARVPLSVRDVEDSSAPGTRIEGEGFRDGIVGWTVMGRGEWPGLGMRRVLGGRPVEGSAGGRVLVGGVGAETEGGHRMWRRVLEATAFEGSLELRSERTPRTRYLAIDTAQLREFAECASSIERRTARARP